MKPFGNAGPRRRDAQVTVDQYGIHSFYFSDQLLSAGLRSDGLKSDSGRMSGLGRSLRGAQAFLWSLDPHRLARQENPAARPR